ncbi:MAG: hypothetical protein P1V97_25275, partial [Planctomycetota bacterium]|nr:hypothetical protein [Planctomycetota bacterium]
KKNQKLIKDIDREVRQQWLDEHGFMRLYKKSKKLDNENPVLFTSEYLYVLWRLGALTGELREFWCGSIRRSIKKLQLEPGLYNRYPKSNSSAFKRHFSRDEQIGLIVFDRVFDWELGYSKDILDYGQRHSFVYSNRSWSGPETQKRTVLDKTGRAIPRILLDFIGKRDSKLIELFLASNGYKTESGQLFTRVGLADTTARKKGETSGKMLALLRFEVIYGVDRETDRAIQNFLQELRSVYGRNVYSALADIYFLDTSHPVRRLAKLLRKNRMF